MSAKDLELKELDAKADEILSKSQAAEEKDLEKSGNVEEKDVEKVDIEESENDLAKGKADKKAEKADEDDMEDAEVEEEIDDEEDEDEEEEDETKKSIREMIEENEVIQKSHDVSPFLQEWSYILTRALENMQYTIEKSIKEKVEDIATPVLVKSMKALLAHQEGLEELIKSQKQEIEEQSKLIKSLQERLEKIEKQPMPRKSVVNVVEKSFAKSVGIEEQETLSKAQVAARLERLAMEGKIDPMVVISYDSTGQLSPEIEQLVRDMK